MLSYTKMLARTEFIMVPKGEGREGNTDYKADPEPVDFVSKQAEQEGMSIG